MQKYLRFMIVVLLIGVVLGKNKITENKSIKENVSNVQNSIIGKNASVNNNFQEYGDYKVYYLSDDVYYLKGKNIDDLIMDKDLVDKLKDGGTTIYKNEQVTVIKCHTLDGNNDIYVGNKNLNYNMNYCEK